MQDGAVEWTRGQIYTFIEFQSEVKKLCYTRMRMDLTVLRDAACAWVGQRIVGCGLKRNNWAGRGEMEQSYIDARG